MLLACIIASALCIVEALLGGYEFYLFRGGSSMAAVSCAVFTGLALVSLLYALGICYRVECLLLPLLTGQLVLVASFGLFVIIWWIATLLAFFDLVHYKSPIDAFSTTEFFFVFGVVVSISFVIYTKVSQILYKGYKSVEKSRCEEFMGNGHICNSQHSFPPTTV